MTNNLFSFMHSACVDGKSSCGTDTCEVWSDWGPWSECDVTCGEDGVKTSVRSCVGEDDLDNFDGCPGEDNRVLDCTLEPCEGNNITSVTLDSLCKNISVVCAI